MNPKIELSNEDKQEIDQTHFRTYKEFIAKGDHPPFAFLMASIASQKVQSALMKEKREEYETTLQHPI